VSRKVGGNSRKLFAIFRWDMLEYSLLLGQGFGARSRNVICSIEGSIRLGDLIVVVLP
jgi:hypothetical protein